MSTSFSLDELCNAYIEYSILNIWFWIMAQWCKELCVRHYDHVTASIVIPRRELQPTTDFFYFTPIFWKGKILINWSLQVKAPLFCIISVVVVALSTRMCGPQVVKNRIIEFPWIWGTHITGNWHHAKLMMSILLGLFWEDVLLSTLLILRGHLGVPDTVSESLIVPLHYLVILHLRGFQAHDFRNLMLPQVME